MKSARAAIAGATVALALVPAMLAAVLPAVRAVDGVIDVEAQLSYAIDDTRLPHTADVGS